MTVSRGIAWSTDGALRYASMELLQALERGKTVPVMTPVTMIRHSWSVRGSMGVQAGKNCVFSDYLGALGVMSFLMTFPPFITNLTR